MFLKTFSHIEMAEIDETFLLEGRTLCIAYIVLTADDNATRGAWTSAAVELT